MVDHFRVALYSIVLAIGFLVGLEIPLLMRILREGFDFREVVSTVLTFAYVGALAASLLFPLLLFPYPGRTRTGSLFGIPNAGVPPPLPILLPSRAERRLARGRPFLIPPALA